MNARQLSYAIAASCIWLGCTTSSSTQTPHAAPSDTQEFEQDSVNLSPRQQSPTQVVEAQEEFVTSPPRFTCPNGWQEEREMPFYAIEDHTRFLQELPGLDQQTVLLELRVSYSPSFTKDAGPTTAKIGQPVIVVPIEEVLADYDDLDFTLMHQSEILPGKDLDKCWVAGAFYERYSESLEQTIQDPILRIVALLEVSDITTETSRHTLKVIAHPR